MQHIDFEAKSDRELLILVAQKTNEIVSHLAKLNDTVAKHERRLVVLDTQARCDASQPVTFEQRIKGNWQMVLGFTSLLSAAFYAIGRGCGWW